MTKFELKLPKMGESVAEATLTSWLKEVGDTIEEDEAVLEIATDKVDSEVPSEVTGVLVEKLFAIVGGKTAQGISNDLGEDVFPKGKKFTLKMLNSVDDYAHLVSGKWTTDAATNKLVSELIHNYKIKENDLQGSLRREKFTISVGDELPAGIIKLAKVYIAKKRKLKVGDKIGSHSFRRRSRTC